ncbi:MAG: dTMP kinase [Cyanobacteria bacterium CRU_2_1]|nr:dTMP kinase [Cyanobacteria bacterium RU_5_0]NJR57571.1 dTMP kinase [Cyanobacteria bacterium CRU_2_1]
MQGRLIVFEGVEGCGKTTQIARSHLWLQDSGILESLQTRGNVSQLMITREPGGTEVGRAIRQLLLYPASQELVQNRTELLLYAADRAQHVEEILKPHLAEGGLILCDRYTDSTIAYQGYGRGLDRALIDQLNQIATSGLQSDLTLWLDVDVEIGLARAKQRGVRDRIEQATIDFHRRVQQGFNELARTYPDRMVRVDASLNETEVAQAIQTILQTRLAQWYT